MANVIKSLVIVLLAAVFFSAVAEARGARRRADGKVARWLLGVVASLAVLATKAGLGFKAPPEVTLD